MLRVESAASELGGLIAAARAVGLHVGWLELGGGELDASSELVTAARSGALRAVSVGAEGSVAVKRRAGEVVLRDVLREHFAGCGLVLVRGQVAAPLLEIAADDGWVLESAGSRRRLSTNELLARLRRPRLG